MKFNASKCYILSISRDQSKKSNFHYQLNETNLKHVTTNPYLGILFSDNLSWSAHISKITSKANSTLGFLQRNLQNCPRKCKQTAYVSLVRSLVEYGATLWDPHLKKEIDSLERIQRKALRFIYGDFKNYSPGTIDKLQQRSGLPSLQDRRKALRLTFMYKLVEGLVPAMPPASFIEFNKPGRQIRPRRTPDYSSSNITDRHIRNNNRTIKITSSNCEQFKQSFFIRTAVDWNQFSDSVVQATSLETFKSKLHTAMKLD